MILFLPNVLNEQFKNFWNCLRNSQEEQNKRLRTLLQTNWVVFRCLNVVVRSKNDTGDLTFFRFNQSSEISYQGVQIEELFVSERKTASIENAQRLNFISSVLSLSSLNVIVVKSTKTGCDRQSEANSEQPLHVDKERYFIAFDLWRKTQFCSIGSPIHFFILSHQRHAILQEGENMSHVFIYGEPGTGKTYMLQAKCSLLLEQREVDHIIIAVPDSGTRKTSSIEDSTKNAARNEATSCNVSKCTQRVGQFESHD